MRQSFPYNKILLLFVLHIILTLISSETENFRLSRIAFGSCNHQLKGNVFNEIRETSPDKLILLGDSMYADTRSHTSSVFEAGSPQKIKEAYNLISSHMSWPKLVSSLHGWDNIFAIYDDHDYGLNNADKTFIYRNESMQLFWDFTTLPKDSPKRNQTGVYSSKQIFVSNEFSYKIVLLDTRSNKDPSNTSNGDFLGVEQWDWLEHELLSVPQPELIILGSGIQVLPTDKILEETWNALPAARERLLNLISRVREVTDIILISGDIHSAEVLQATCTRTSSSSSKAEDNEESFPLWEFTSSGMSHTITKVLTPTPPYEMKSTGSLISFLYGYYQVM